MGSIEALVKKHPELHGCLEDIEQAYQILFSSFRDGGKLLVCGNGGSASDSEHIVGELMKGFMMPRLLSREVTEQFINAYGDEGERLAGQLQCALPAISLVGPTALNTAIANDTDAAMIFAQQVYGYGQPGDVLLALSTSGNSKNVVSAVQVASIKGMKSIVLTGKNGGKLSAMCDVAIRVPYVLTPEVQERHLPIYHALCIALEEAFFAK